MNDLTERIGRLIERLQEEQRALQVLLGQGRTLDEADRLLAGSRGRRVLRGPAGVTRGARRRGAG